MFAIALPFLGGIGAPECIIILVILSISVIPLWLFWKAFERTGQSKGYAFLVLIPYGGWLIALAVLAFGRWPSPAPVNGPASETKTYVSPAPPAPPVVAVAAGWLTDPSGEHELRYWDGNAWTTNVHDG